jgi:hypothetical protein
MPRTHRIGNQSVPFTAAEETARDLEETQMRIERSASVAKEAEKKALEDKLADDTITFAEMKLLMRIDRGQS